MTTDFRSHKIMMIFKPKLSTLSCHRKLGRKRKKHFLFKTIRWSKAKYKTIFFNSYQQDR